MRYTTHTFKPADPSQVLVQIPFTGFYETIHSYKTRRGAFEYYAKEYMKQFPLPNNLDVTPHEWHTPSEYNFQSDVLTATIPQEAVDLMEKELDEAGIDYDFEPSDILAAWIEHEYASNSDTGLYCVEESIHEYIASCTDICYYCEACEDGDNIDDLTLEDPICCECDNDYTDYL